MNPDPRLRGIDGHAVGDCFGKCITGIEGNRISSVEALYGGLARATGAISAERQFANDTATALARLNTNDIGTRNQQAIGDLNAERKQQSEYLKVDQDADTRRWKGDKAIMGAEWLSQAVRTRLSDSKTGRQTLQGRVAGSIIELGGGAYGLYQVLPGPRHVRPDADEHGGHAQHRLAGRPGLRAPGRVRDGAGTARKVPGI